MGSAARFVLLLAAGVVIVVLYVRTGESLVVLALSLLTLLVGLVLVDRRPWVVDGTGSGPDDLHGDDTWRCGHDVVWDRQGIRAVAIGDRLPSLTLWSRIDRIAVGLHSETLADQGAERRRGLHLVLDRRDGELVASAGRGDVWLCLGPDQDPDRVAGELSRARRRMAPDRTDRRPDPMRPHPPSHRGPNPPLDR